VDNLTLSY